jgi:hypothetical protein
MRKSLKGEPASASVVIPILEPSGALKNKYPAGMAPIATNNWTNPRNV